VCGQKLHLEDEQTLKNWFSYIKVGEGRHLTKGLSFTMVKPMVSPPGESDFKKVLITHKELASQWNCRGQAH
jgi:hypothetical protein